MHRRSLDAEKQPPQDEIRERVQRGDECAVCSNQEGRKGGRRRCGKECEVPVLHVGAEWKMYGVALGCPPTWQVVGRRTAQVKCSGNSLMTSLLVSR